MVATRRSAKSDAETQPEDSVAAGSAGSAGMSEASSAQTQDPAVEGMAEGNPEAQTFAEASTQSNRDAPPSLPSAGEEALDAPTSIAQPGETAAAGEPATQGMNVAEVVDAVVPPTPQPGNEEPATEGMTAEPASISITVDTNAEPATAGMAAEEVLAVLPPTPAPGNVDLATEGMSTNEGHDNATQAVPAAAATQQPDSSNAEPATEGMALSEVPAVNPPTLQAGNTEPATEGMAEGDSGANASAQKLPTTFAVDPGSATDNMQVDASAAPEPTATGAAPNGNAGDVSMQSDSGELREIAVSSEREAPSSSAKDVTNGQPIDEIRSRTKIYIGGLPPRTERADLEDCFGQFGEIDLLELKTGYAFIEYRKPESAAEAIETYNEGHFLGAQLKVESSKSTGTQRANIENNTCFVCGESGHYARTCPSDPRHSSRPPESDYGGRDDRSASRDDRRSDRERDYRRPPRRDDPSRARLPADFHDPHTRESARYGPRDPYSQRERDRDDAARDRDREMRKMMDSGRFPPGGPPPFMMGGPHGYGPPPMMGGPYGGPHGPAMRGPPGWIPDGGPPPMMRGPPGMGPPPRGYDFDGPPSRFYDGPPDPRDFRGPPPIGRDDYPGRFEDRDRDRGRERDRDRRYDRDRSPSRGGDRRDRERDRDYHDDPYYRGGPSPPGMGYPPRGFPGDGPRAGPPHMGSPPFSAPPYGGPPPGYDRRRSPPPMPFPPRGAPFDYPPPGRGDDRGYYPPGGLPPPGAYDDRRGPPGYGPDRGRDGGRDERYTPYPSPGGRNNSLPRSSLPPPPIPPPGR